MALVKCKQCGNDVAPNAAACPKCGAPQPKRTSSGRVVFFVVAGVAGMCFVGNCIGAMGKARMKEGGGTASAATTSEAPSATPVDIRTLLREYGDNEVRADSNYKGHVIQTTGLVGDVKKDFTNSIYVTLGTGRQLEIPQVQCFFDDEHAKKAATLSKGSKVTVRGQVDGLMMNVLVKHCEFVDL